MAVSQSITLTQGTQSVANNTTEVTFKWTSTQSGASYNDYTKTAYYYVSINGGTEKKYSVSYTLPKSKTKTIVSKTFTVAHKDDGTGSIKVRTWMNTGISAGTVEKSKTLTLTTIPRASSITSASDITLGNACNIAWTPASKDFKYKIKFELGDWSHTTGFIEPEQTSTYTYTGYTISGTTTKNSTTIYKELPNDTSGTMTATLTTYNSSETKIGSSSSKTFTVTIPSGVKPSIGSMILNPYNITTVDGASRNILVKDKNKMEVKAEDADENPTCTPGNGSSIKNYKFEVLSGSTVIATKTTTSSSVTFDPFSSTGTLKFRLTVTDDRGRSNSNSGNEPTWTCNAYAPPSFSSFTAYRCNSSGTADDNGTYIKYDLKVNYSSVDSTNKSTVKIYYKKSADSSWTTAKDALTNSTTKSAAAIIKNTSGTNITFDASSTYMVYATVTDNYNGSVKSSSVTVFGASRIFNIRKNGTGIALGKMAESNNLFECKWPAKFDSKVEIIGSVTVPGDDGSGPIINGYSVGTLGVGKNIPSDDDLNNYITPGVYRSTGATVSETLSNTPFTAAGFKLVVEYIASTSYLIQTLIPRLTNCAYYKRYYNGTWYDWRAFKSSEAIEDIIDDKIGDIDFNSVDNLTIGANQYHASSKFGIDMQNSDIINANGIYFQDATNSAGEGINFYNSSGKWDTLYTDDGLLKFHQARGTSTGLSGNTVYTSANFRRGSCTLSCSSETTVSFSSNLSSDTPTIMLTPLTSTSGVITAKVTARSKSGFTAIIGGSPTSEAKFMYLAICY